MAEKVIKLRPHHLLCTQAYQGKGYSEDFVSNMSLITNKVRSEDATKVEVVFYTDDLCVDCPHKLGENLCDTNEKVNRYDQKVIEYFNIEEKEYTYQEIAKEIREHMTEDMLYDICGKDCEWYPISLCKERLCKAGK